MHPGQIITNCYNITSQNTLSAFVNHNHHHQQQQQQQQKIIADRSSLNHHRMLLCGGASNRETPPHHQQREEEKRCANENTDCLQSLLSSVNNNKSLNIANHHHHQQQQQQGKTAHHSKFVGHSNTLPPNSTLSSLMATFKSCEHQNMMHHNLHRHHYYQQEQPHQQQQLRRQISLNHLDKINKNISKGNSLNNNHNHNNGSNNSDENNDNNNNNNNNNTNNKSKNESKVSLFQQKIRAILLSSPKENNHFNNSNSNNNNNNNKLNLKHKNVDSTYRSYGNVSQTFDEQENEDDDHLHNSNNQLISCFSHESLTSNNNHNNHNNEATHRWIPTTISNGNEKIDSCLLNTLNKYTVSASSNNLSNISSRSNELESTESDHYDLRTVCNKLFANKQYPCLHPSTTGMATATTTTADNSLVASSMQKSSSSSDRCYRNITPNEMNVDKVARKESIYSYANNNNNNKSDSMVSTVVNSNQSSDSINLINSSYSSRESTIVDNNIAGHIVIVKEINSDNSKCPNGLTVRPPSPPLNSIHSNVKQHQPISNNNNNINNNSNNNNNNSNNNNNNNNNSNHNDNQGSILSLNGAEASESVESQDHNYKSSSESGRGTMNSQVEDRSLNNIDLNSPVDLTSLDSDQSNNEKCARRSSDSKCKNSFNKIQRYLGEPSNPNSNETEVKCNEFKSKLSINEESDSWTSLSDDPTTLKKSTSKSKTIINTNKIIAPGMKHRYQPDNKLKTDFSKPENCMNINLKQSKISVSTETKCKLSPNSHKFVENPNTISYDKCIYSVPDKGKYRNYTTEAFRSKLNETNYQKDCCDDGSISSETHFPDDICSEYAEQQQDHHDPVRKQLKGIEEMYSELLNMLHTKNGDKCRSRKKVFRRNSGRSSVASRTTRDHIYKKYRTHDYRNGRSKSEDNSQILARCKRLESQVLTLAKSVSQLSLDIQYNYSLNDQIQNLKHDMEMLKSQMVMVKQNLINNNNSNKFAVPHQQFNGIQSTITPINKNHKDSKKVDKLKRLFLDEPQPMKQFLKKLGYEKYLKNFESEKIGIAELIHLDEDKLQKIGIPMGPRLRMAQEIKNLALLVNSMGKQSEKTAQNISDNFNIYAIV